MTKQILIDEDKVKLALEKYMSAFGQALEAHGIPFQEQQIMADRQAREALAQSRSDVKQEPKPFGYTLEETMKCWDLGYAAAVKALAKQEQGEPDDLTIAYMSGLHRGKDLAQQRTWVGLTIKELQDIFNEPDLPEFVTESVRIIEAKLKEKNT